MIARILRVLVPGAFLVGILFGGAALAQSTTQQGLPQASPSPGPGATKYTLPDTFSNQSHPAPTATPKPDRLSVSGKLRGYYFLRENSTTNATNINKHAIEFSALPHLDYHIGDSPFNIGYTYGGAIGPNGPDPIANPVIDNTLPGYPLDQPVHELYVQYKDARNFVTVGDQELNYPWAPNSDSRIVPASYQGIDSSFAIGKGLSFGLTRIMRFEQRNSSNFEPNTLLTAPYPGANSVIATNTTITPGTLRVGLTYKPLNNFSLMAENYEYYNIANLAYAEGKVGMLPTSKANPYLAVQYVAENSLGTNQIGRIDNHTIGAQFGVNVAKGLLFTASTDIAPWHYAFVDAATMAAATKGYFAPGGGTGAAVAAAPLAVAAGPGLYRIAYGGIASPYTDSLGTDPLYTTMITQGMADRRSAGNSYKTALVYTSPSKQLKLIADEAWFNYSNAISRNLTSEFNADGTYFFNKVRPGPYKGFFVRVRIAPRTIPTVPYTFTYERFITEYDF